MFNSNVVCMIHHLEQKGKKSEVSTFIGFIFDRLPIEKIHRSRNGCDLEEKAY